MKGWLFFCQAFCLTEDLMSLTHLKGIRLRIYGYFGKAKARDLIVAKEKPLHFTKEKPQTKQKP